MALSGPTLTVKSQNYEVSSYETTGHYVKADHPDPDNLKSFRKKTQKSKIQIHVFWIR